MMLRMVSGAAFSRSYRLRGLLFFVRVLVRGPSALIEIAIRENVELARLSQAIGEVDAGIARGQKGKQLAVLRRRRSRLHSRGVTIRFRAGDHQDEKKEGRSMLRPFRITHDLHSFA